MEDALQCYYTVAIMRGIGCALGNTNCQCSDCVSMLCWNSVSVTQVQVLSTRNEEIGNCRLQMIGFGEVFLSLGFSGDF